MPEEINGSLSIKQAREDFLKTWPKVKEYLCKVDEGESMDETVDWLSKSLDYNVKDGKMIRGVLSILSFWNFSPDEVHREKHMEKAYMLGWTIEILQGACLVADDLMDQSTTRRGHDCWYRVKNVGMQAVNDAFMLAYGAMKILQQAFYGTEFYSPIVELINEICFKTTLGQNLDSQIEDVGKFSMKRYASLVKFKTSYYSFFGPVMAGMILGGGEANTSKEETAIIKEILLEIGLFFQAQDDMLDAFGDPVITGKVGTDIQDRKCTWLLATYLDSAPKEDAEKIKVLYADPVANLEEIKALFKAFDIEEKFEDFILEKTVHIRKLCSKLKNQEIAKLLKGILALISSRNR